MALLAYKLLLAKSSEKLMLRRMVLSENSALVAILDFFHELLDIKYIQLERRRQFYNILGLPVSNGDAMKCELVC